MFVGHLAVALGARRIAPALPLWTLVLASFWADLLWAPLLLSGLEEVRIDPSATRFAPLDFRSYPWSHSLLLVLAWAAAFGAIAARRAGGWRPAFLCGSIVASHWILDAVTHRPDLPLWPGGPVAGLGLWNSIAGTMALEGSLLAIAAPAYARFAPARDRAGRLGFGLPLAALAGVWILQPFAPPPPGPAAVAAVGLAAWLLPAWAAWMERHRAAGEGPR